MMTFISLTFYTILVRMGLVTFGKRKFEKSCKEEGLAFLEQFTFSLTSFFLFVLFLWIFF